MFSVCFALRLALGSESRGGGCPNTKVSAPNRRVETPEKMQRQIKIIFANRRYQSGDFGQPNYGSFLYYCFRLLAAFLHYFRTQFHALVGASATRQTAHRGPRQSACSSECSSSATREKCKVRSRRCVPLAVSGADEARKAGEPQTKMVKQKSKLTPKKRQTIWASAGCRCRRRRSRQSESRVRASEETHSSSFPLLARVRSLPHSSGAQLPLDENMVPLVFIANRSKYSHHSSQTFRDYRVARTQRKSLSKQILFLQFVGFCSFFLFV